MNSESLDYYTRLSSLPAKDDRMKSLDVLFTGLRKRFVYDNMAVYLVEKHSEQVEAVYARAVGRGRSKEADAPWGEDCASQVIASGKLSIISPTKKESSDRITMPHLLGVPLEVPDGSGALVFVRFGSPEYTEADLPLAALAAALASRIFERTALQQAASQLELARHRAQLQDDFIATVSHELHTPLGFIKGYTTSLLRADTVWDAATQHEFLTVIDDETDHLVALIDRMLDSARLQSGNLAMEFQPVRLESLLRDEVLRLQDRHPGLEVNLDLISAPPIQADTVRLTQIFDNLFDNALKYAPGSRIEIRLKDEQKYQVITFSDFGPGIAPEHLPYLFERFYRVPGQGGKHGTGLGLFICRQIVQAHHGKISARTVPGKGTSFRIELPLSQALPQTGEA
jgi:signal transduction histidine kinase